MTINELKGIKPIGPMTPEKARIEARIHSEASNNKLREVLN